MKKCWGSLGFAAHSSLRVLRRLMANRGWMLKLDYEAAQRHAARLAKMAKEIVEEKWGKKEE